MIGERINPTGRKMLAAEMAAGDFSRVKADALAQVAAGAHMLDVNAGIPLGRRAGDPGRERSSSCSRSPTCRCRSTPRSSRRWRPALAVYKGKPLVNSVTGEEERLEAVLPLVKKYGAAVVAISNDETGISEDPDVRFAVAKKIVQRAARPRHPAVRHRRRSAGHADRRDQPGGRAGVRTAAAAARGAQGQHHLRRVQHQLRPAAPPRHQRGLPDDG